MNRRNRFNLGFLVIAVLSVLLVQEFWTRSQVVAIPYSEFQKLVRTDKVAQVVVSQDQLQGELKEPLLGGKKRFVTVRVDAEMAKELDAHKVQYAGRFQNDVIPMILSWVLPTLIFFGIWMLLSRRMARQMGGGMGGGLMSIGKSKAKVYVETDTKVTFADVAGVEESKAELQEIVSFLKDPRQHGRLGARMPKGVLLVGPPGTGKTLLAKAVAGEAGVPFFSISGSEFVEMFVGVGAARVRDLFEQARAKAPAIIFIDELDALGRARAAVAGFGGHDEKEQTLNQLLVELDGFDPTSGIVLLAATNRPEVLDPALLRAGRFDRQVLVDRPDRAGRVAILAVHARKVTLAADVKLEEVAALTPGFTGADLANLVNEAALVATRRGASQVSLDDFNVAVERIVAGLEKKNRLLNPREREVVAHHEMGHALVAAALPRLRPGPQDLHHPARHRRAGLHHPAPDRGSLPHDARGAGGQDGGAAGRPRRRAPLLRAPLHRRRRRPRQGQRDRAQHGHPLRHGRGARPGELPDASRRASSGQVTGMRRLYSEETAREIDLAVRELVDAAFRRARVVLEANRSVLDEGARTLLARETLTGDELAALLARVRAEGPRAAA